MKTFFILFTVLLFTMPSQAKAPKIEMADDLTIRMRGVKRLFEKFRTTHRLYDYMSQVYPVEKKIFNSLKKNSRNIKLQKVEIKKGHLLFPELQVKVTKTHITSPGISIRIRPRKARSFRELLLGVVKNEVFKKRPKNSARTPKTWRDLFVNEAFANNRPKMIGTNDTLNRRLRRLLEKGKYLEVLDEIPATPNIIFTQLALNSSGGSVSDPAFTAAFSAGFDDRRAEGERIRHDTKIKCFEKAPGAFEIVGESPKFSSPTSVEVRVIPTKGGASPLNLKLENRTETCFLRLNRSNLKWETTKGKNCPFSSETVHNLERISLFCKAIRRTANFEGDVVIDTSSSLFNIDVVPQGESGADSTR